MKPTINRIGILTGGGDSSGINAAIRSAVRRSESLGISVMGIRRGWAGLVENDLTPLTTENTRGILHEGGTVLGTSRTNPFKDDPEAGGKRLLATISENRLDAVIAMGGDDTLGVAARVSRDLGIPVVGIAQSIDNDIAGTEYSIGFDTAVDKVSEAVRSVRTTCISHDQGIVVEVMGRDTGWIAAASALATEAEFCLVPELPADIGAIAEKLIESKAKGAPPPVIIVAEGVDPEGASRLEDRTDTFGNPYLSGIGYWLRDRLQEMTGHTIRALVVGYFQRGGIPTSYEVQMGVRLGHEAVESLVGGGTGCLIAVRGSEMVPVGLSEVLGRKRYLCGELLDLVRTNWY